MENNTNTVLYTVKQTAEILHSNTAYVYDLIKHGLLPAIKLKSLRVRKSTLDEFLDKYDGYDLSDINNIKPLSF